MIVFARLIGSLKFVGNALLKMLTHLLSGKYTIRAAIREFLKTLLKATEVPKRLAGHSLLRSRHKINKTKAIVKHSDKKNVRPKIHAPKKKNS